MNRRDFIKTLAAIPALAWLKPEAPEVESVELTPADEVVYFTPLQEESIAVGDGNSWSSIAVGPDASIYLGGAFVIPGTISNDEYWAKWSRQDWERLDTIEGELVTQAQSST